ncbi:MAG: peptidylprolyl isomerase [Candidatus Krumholzibacteriia bacterium]
MKTKAYRTIILLAAVAAAGWVSHAGAEKKLVDRVVAVVEDNAIFQSDIEQTIKQFLVQRGKTSLQASERATLEQQALDELIDAKLVLAKARRLGIEVTFDEVERAVEKAIEENKRTLGGDDAFRRQLEAEKLSIDELKRLYREQLSNRMLVDRVLAREISRGSLKVTEDDLLAAYEKKKHELPIRPPVVHLQTVYIALESSENARAQAKKKIEELHARLLAGDDFAEVAEEQSEDPSAKRGGSLGTLKLADLSDRKFAAAAAALSVGEISPPVLTSYGYHLIQVTGADSTVGEVSLRHILVRIKPGEDDIQAVFARAKEVYRQLVEGAPFDSIAMRYSDDEPTAPLGGDLGWLRVKDLPEFFQEVLKTMKPGDMSQVLREPTGFRIVRLIEREEGRPFEFAEVREEIRKMVESEKMTTAYDTYLAGLRGEFYVETRED